METATATATATAKKKDEPKKFSLENINTSLIIREDINTGSLPLWTYCRENVGKKSNEYIVEYQDADSSYTIYPNSGMPGPIDRHNTTPEKKLISPYNPNQSSRTADQLPEHQLCYRCHGDSANLPGRFTNKRQEFSTSNKSFHPVEGEGKNSAVVSLIKPYRAQKSAPGDVSVLTCGSCHASDNRNAPRGPHGSQHEGILTDHYSKDDNSPENSYQYSLCYRCHKRDSILSNESFKFHSIHIQGIPGKNRGTSCYTCHNSHGSQENKYLIKFSPQVVSPNKSGQLKFMENGNSRFSGKCFLSCHGVDHNPKSY